MRTCIPLIANSQIPLISGSAKLYHSITFFIGLGFSLFFSFIKNQYQYIQILGSLYVIYLAYKFYKAGTYNENAKNLNCTFMDESYCCFLILKRTL